MQAGGGNEADVSESNRSTQPSSSSIVGKSPPSHSSTRASHITSASPSSAAKQAFQLIDQYAHQGNFTGIKAVYSTLSYPNALDINTKGRNGRTPLLTATVAGHLEIVKYLYSQGASIKERDTFGYTPLLSAAFRGHLEIVKWLLTCANASAAESNLGQTVFLSAVRGGHVAVAKWLLSAEGGASLHERDKNQNSALLIAAWSGKLEMVKWLLGEGGSSADEIDKSGFNALHLAASAGRVEVVKYLIAVKHFNCQQRDPRGYTPLLLAASGGHLDVVKWLLREGGSRVDEETRGQTALLSAARGGQIPVVEWLLREGGSRITETDHTGHTALLFAARSNRVSTVKWLLEKGGANINDSANGYTALLLAASNDNLEMVQYLVKEAKVSIKQETCGQTALLSAARSGHVRIAKWLLSQGGADVAETDIKGNTALLMAAWSGHLEMVKWLLNEGGSSVREVDLQDNNALHLAVWSSHLSVIEYLIKEARINMNSYNKNYQTPLMLAAQLCSAPLPPSSASSSAQNVSIASPTAPLRLLLQLGAGIGCLNFSNVFQTYLAANQKDEKFGAYLLIGSDVSLSAERSPLLSDCVFTAKQLRSAMLAGADIDRWTVREIVLDFLQHRGSGATARIDKSARKQLQDIEDDQLYALLPGSSLLNLGLNFLNTTRDGKRVLQTFLTQKGAKLGSGRALPRDIEDRLLPPDLTPQQDERMRERERERAREAEKQSVYKQSLSRKESGGSAIATKDERCIVQ